MTIAIMQPYFFPYIGYFQLLNAVDEFVVYDNIQFTKKGWINRNRILVNGKDDYITLPLKKDSDYLNVKDRYLAEVWKDERKKMLNKIMAAYKKAPFFDLVFPVVEKIIVSAEANLFNYILNSLQLLKDYLEIKTSIIISSSIAIDHQLKAEKKVIAICKEQKAETYLNPIRGVELYSKDEFSREGIELLFIETEFISYQQFKNEFVSSLSIIDVMMFNSKEKLRSYLKDSYTIS